MGTKKPFDTKLRHPQMWQEEVGVDTFTNREDILAKLWKWGVGIDLEASKSIALISPRRYGKTAVMQRFYNKFFWEQDRVAPFFIEISRQVLTMDMFADWYFTEFLRQYMGFYLKDPKVWGLTTMESLLDAAKEHADVLTDEPADMIMRYRKLNREPASWFELWNRAMRAPHTLCDRTGRRVAVMIDEFQDLDDRIRWWDGDKIVIKKDITGGFNVVCSKINAPMLVSGSLVTIISRKVFGGPLGGRFAPRRMTLMKPEDCLKLAYRLAERHDIDLTAEAADMIVRLSGGNPYYVWCAFVSEYEEKDLTTIDGVRDVYDFEVRDTMYGLIHDFWSEHFRMNMRYLNADEEGAYGTTKKIIYYIIKEERPVTRKEIMEKFNLSEAKADEKLDNLLKADLIRCPQSASIYEGLNDKMLEAVLKYKFEHEIAGVEPDQTREEVERDLRERIAGLEKEKRSMRGEINTLIGEVGEVIMKRVARRMSGKELGGRYFGMEGKVNVPAFKEWPRKKEMILTGGQGEEKRVQLDLYMEAEEGEDIWIGEAKNRKEPAGIEVVERMREIGKKIETERRGDGETETRGNGDGERRGDGETETRGDGDGEKRGDGDAEKRRRGETGRRGEGEGGKKVRTWIYSAGGFTQDAVEAMRKEDILHTTKEEMLDLMDELGMITRKSSES